MVGFYKSLFAWRFTLNMNEKNIQITNSKEYADVPGCFHLSDCKLTRNIFYLAFPVFYPFLSENANSNLQKMLFNEIAALQGNFFVDNVKIEYKSLENIEDFGNITRLSPQRKLRPRKFFLFQMTISNASHLMVPYDKFSAETNFILYVFSYMKNFAYSLAYALGIYCDAGIDVDNFIIYYNDANYGVSEGLLSSFSGLRKTDDFFSKELSGLTLQKTLKWILSIDDVQNACGKTALGKSLSIYSRMFSSTSGDDEVFMNGLFSVMALEALYESNGARKTLIEKVTAFLNIDKKKCKEDIDEIYNHRCSVAHGGFELPFKFNAQDGSKDFEKSYDKTEKAFGLGTQYLLESYKKMILENKKELSFVYSCL